MPPTTYVKMKRTQLLASQMSRLVSDSNENLLRINLSKFFTDLEQDIQKALFEYWSNTDLKKGQVNLILAPIHEKHQEYYELIMNHKLNEFRRSERIGTLLVFNERQKKHVAMKAENPVNFEHSPNNLFGTLPHTEQTLANQTFTASEGTLKRVDSNINDILTDGYKSGKGIDVVSKQITERFDQLRTWESTRIARTEIHGAQNQGIMSTYESLGVEYTQWIAANDDRTRDSHAEIDGEIIRMGDTYSNGLMFPGDTSGDIEEWINCRCSNAPFVMPAGMMAPEGMEQFRESDLVPINEMQETQEEPQSDSSYLQNIEEVLKEATDTHGEYSDLMSSVEKFYKSTKDAPIEMMGILDYNKKPYKSIGAEHDVPIPYEAIYQGITEGIYFAGHNHPKNSTSFQSYADFENTVLCNMKYSYTVGKDGFFIIKNNNVDMLTVDDLPYNVGDKYTATKMLVEEKKKQYEQNGNPILETYNEVYNQIVDDFNKQYSKEIDEIHKNATVHNKEFGVDELDFGKIDRETKELFDNHMHKNIKEYTHILNNRLSKHNVNVYYVPKK